MKIILDEIKKEGVLLKNDGTEISRYSFKNIINEDFTLEDLRADIENFNTTLSRQEEFDCIKRLSDPIKIHAW